MEDVRAQLAGEGALRASRAPPVQKIAADDPAIMLAEDLPVAAVLGNVTVCVQVTRHGRPRA
jgi:hypothetical protein